MKQWFFLQIILSTFICNAQDTIFVKSHDLKNIRNIDVLDSKLLIRFTNSYLFYSNNKYFKEENLPNKTKSFTWTDNSAENSNIYHSDYFPKDKLFKKTYLLKRLIPGEISENISIGRIKNTLFICWKGKLLEYKIYNHYKHILKDCSIRHIYRDQNINIVSSYCGIFNYDENFIKSNIFKSPTYSNGELNYINNNYYLCSDDLYILKNNNFNFFWKRDGTEKFREMISFNGKTYALFEHSFSEINLEQKQEKLIKKIKNLSDIENQKSHLLLSSENGGLYVYKNNQIKKVFNCSTGIYDIEFFNNSIFLCCDDGIRILNKNYVENKFIALYKPINIINIDNALITSTYEGLYYIDLIKNKSYNLIPDVEFNKKALIRFDNYIYAGSVQGLYVVNIVELSTNFLESFESKTILTETNNILYIIVICVLLFMVLFIIAYFKRKKTTQALINQKGIFDNMDDIYEIIKTNPNIKSVEDLATYIGVSSPTLITKIKKQTGLNPLEYLKNCKKNIANELVNQGVSINEISIRVGYSVRYIKNHFLK